MTPVEPPKKAMGRNTADSTRAMPTRAPVISPIERRVASFGESFSSSITRSTFSTTTIASSTNRPMASTMPNMVSVLIENPAAASMAKVPKQHHRHGDGWNQRGAEILQEQVHHQKHQHDRLEQRLHHLIDGDAHERRGVIGIDELEAGREERRQLVHGGAHRLGGVQRVRARGELHRQARRRLAVVLGVDRIALGAEADAGDVPEPHLRAVGVHLEQHAAERLRHW